LLVLQEVFADEIVLEPHGRKSGDAVDQRSQEDKGHLEADGLNTVTYHFCTELNLKRVKNDVKVKIEPSMVSNVTKCLKNTKLEEYFY
jgi:hypothetical protein